MSSERLTFALAADRIDFVFACKLIRDAHFCSSTRPAPYSELRTDFFGPVAHAAELKQFFRTILNEERGVVVLRRGG